MEAPKESTPLANPAPSHGVEHPSSSPPPPKTTKSSFSLRWIMLVVGIVVVVLSVFLYIKMQSNQTVPSSQQTNSTITPSQSLVVGTDPTLQPMEFIQNEKMVGYDIDLANALAKELDVQVEFKNIVFDNLFTALEQNDIDMIISAVTITEERQQKFDFSKEYLNAGQVIITKKMDTSITSTANLKGKRIAVQKGTTNETEALKYTAPTLVIRYPDFEQATAALVAGKVDAVFTDLPSAKGITLTNPTLKISSDPFTNEYYGIVFRKGDARVQQINDALESLDEKGILVELKQKWLN